jgi:UDP-N-acetylglucosamine diphosphorylase/glucosamine-1-phosphate N-acetyltransferase
MKHIILFDDENRDNLLPLVYTRPVSDLRIGILRISEKWAKNLNAQVSYITQDYLSKKFPIAINSDNLIINGALLPNPKILALIKQLGIGEAILFHDRLVAARIDEHQFNQLIQDKPIDELDGIEIDEDSEPVFVNQLWDLFRLNGDEIIRDFELLAKSRKSVPLPKHVAQFGDQPVFVEEGAILRPCTINTEEGPVYIGKNAEVMEGVSIRGPFSMGEHSVLKMGAKVYSNSSMGEYCKVGGEINNVNFHSYSSKAHDGFLGNAVIGAWCNLGADSNNSNLKNNYAKVKLWNYPAGSFVDTGLQFCGLIMGDHTKCGINTMFNTGTVIGVSSNIFGSGFPRNFIPSFSWGGASGYKTFTVGKALETAEIVMRRRNLEMNEIEEAIIRKVYEISGEYRAWETNKK